MKKAIVTVIGKDKVGIIAATATELAECGVNILDITQTIMQDYFTMIMLVDVGVANAPFTEIKDRLGALGQKLGMSIRIQHEDIFNSSFRV